MTRQRRAPLVSLEVQGNNGESYVRLTVDEDEDNYVYLEVGETCVVTIRERVHVAALAAVLTRAHAIGFRQMLTDYGWPPEFIESWSPA